MNFYSKKDKATFVENLKKKTKKISVDIISFCDSLPKTTSGKVITYQLIKSGTSTGANYRTVCIACSKAEFHAKLFFH